MAQILAFVAVTTSISGVMLGLVLRSMSAQRSELSAKIEGVHTGLNEKIDGLRNEMNARLEPLRSDVNRLDQDVRELRKEIASSVKPQLT